MMEALAVTASFCAGNGPTLRNNWAVPQGWLKSASVAGRSVLATAAQINFRELPPGVKCNRYAA